MTEPYGLTDRFVAGAKVTNGAVQSDYFEPKPKWRGLAIRVSKTGLKTWCFFFSWNGKRVRMSLGNYPAVSVAEAHTRAIEARSYLQASLPADPRVAMKSKNDNAVTVAALAEAYLTMRARPKLRSAKKIELTLRRHVLPVIGNVPLADLHKRDVNRVIDPIVGRGKKVAAARAFQIMRAMFSWAVGRGDLDRNPMEKMPRPDDYNPRERTLSGAEIKVFWEEIAGACEIKSVARILKLCLVTAQRVGEVAGMTQAELDLDAGTWKIPEARSKNKHAHEVPLSPLAVTLIREALSDAGDSDFVFPGQRGARIGMNTVWGTVIKARAKLGLPHWSSHDLRRTAANSMQEFGVLDGIIGHVLNHRSVTRATVTQKHYTPRIPHREMRQALELWADRLTGIIKGQPVADVVALQSKAS
jgi:integrase